MKDKKKDRKEPVAWLNPEPEKEEDNEEVADFGLSPDEFAEETHRLQPSLPFLPREKDVEVQTKNLPALPNPREKERARSLATRNLKEK